MVRQDIVMFKDDNEMHSAAIERLNNYYTELDKMSWDYIILEI